MSVYNIIINNKYALKLLKLLIAMLLNYNAVMCINSISHDQLKNVYVQMHKSGF